MGSRYALAVSSCSAALFLSLKALDLPRGAKVLIPAFTFAAVPSAVVHADCTPVLVEVGDNYRVDMADFEAKLDDAAAVMISHMRGHTSDMDAIMALCKRRGFIYQTSDIYGGINGFWDYGPLGVELKNNVKRAWWRANVYERDDMEGARLVLHGEVGQDSFARLLGSGLEQLAAVTGKPATTAPAEGAAQKTTPS